MISQATELSLSATAGKAAPTPESRLRQAAEQLEATFLAEMLKAAGLGKPRASFGGGAGEEQFGSFLREQQASAMARHGGIGLAERIFNALKESHDARK